MIYPAMRHGNPKEKRTVFEDFVWIHPPKPRMGRSSPKFCRFFRIGNFGEKNTFKQMPSCYWEGGLDPTLLSLESSISSQNRLEKKAKQHLSING